MNEGDIVHETELNVSGKNYTVQVFRRGSGKCYALTQLSESDVIIIDGNSLEDVLERHRFSLPLAIDCRRQQPGPRLSVIKYTTQLS